MRQQASQYVLPLHCSFVHQQNLWMVMPYVAGGSVLNIMKYAYPEVRSWAPIHDGMFISNACLFYNPLSCKLAAMHSPHLHHPGSKSGHKQVKACPVDAFSCMGGPGISRAVMDLHCTFGSSLSWMHLVLAWPGIKRCPRLLSAVAVQGLTTWACTTNGLCTMTVGLKVNACGPHCLRLCVCVPAKSLAIACSYMICMVLLGWLVGFKVGCCA